LNLKWIAPLVKQLLLWRWFCFIEKYVGSRHIEIQVMADSHGNVLYLFEENAASSVVTKSIEEAPSSVLTPGA
jgi:acetyl/propionyl-CoA carboxylase alpha subunit